MGEKTCEASSLDGAEKEENIVAMGGAPESILDGGVPGTEENDATAGIDTGVSIIPG